MPNENPDDKDEIIEEGDVLTDNAEIDDIDDELNMPSELDLLKDKAKVMGIQHSPNIGAAALRKKIDEKLASENTLSDEQVAIRAAEEKKAPATKGKAKVSSGIPDLKTLLKYKPDDFRAMPEKLRKRAIRLVQIHEQTKLVRVKVFNNDPAKNDLHGEILTVGNKYVPSIRKFVPFSDKPYHLEVFLLNVLRRKKYQKLKPMKQQDGTETLVKQLVPEYTIEVLPDLTKKELEELALKQEASKRVGLI